MSNHKFTAYEISRLQNVNIQLVNLKIKELDKKSCKYFTISEINEMFPTKAEIQIQKVHTIETYYIIESKINKN